MAVNPDFKLKLADFWRKYNKIIIIVVFVILLIIAVNRYLTKHKAPSTPETSYTPHATLLTSSSESRKRR